MCFSKSATVVNQQFGLLGKAEFISMEFVDGDHWLLRSYEIPLKGMNYKRCTVG